MSEFVFTRVVYPLYNRDGTLKRAGWAEQWQLTGSHTSTMPVGGEASSVAGCVGCDSRLKREAPRREAGSARKGESGGAKQSPDTHSGDSA